MDRPVDPVPNPAGDDLQMVDLTEPAPSESLEDQASPAKSAKPKWYRRRRFQIAAIIFIVLCLLFGFLAFVGYQTSGHIQSVADHGKGVAAAIEERDLLRAKSELASADQALAFADQSYRRLNLYSHIPFFGLYIRDGQHALKAADLGLETGDMVLMALEPYADVLGFTGGEVVEFESAEERIIFLSDTVEKLAPQMDGISAKLGEISKELETINENRYPKTVQGTEVRGEIAGFKSSVKSTSTSLSQFQPFVRLLPDLLGNPEARDYLILFQNDAELRPTGGFMTAYATMNVHAGKITSGVSEDIYTLDSAFTKKVPAPDPIRKYLPLVYNWNLRDMNLSPDFKISMDTFTQYYQQVPIAPKVDAIIAIDTQVPVRILEILGPIGVPGYGGQFSADPDPRCDNTCPQVIYELENIITRPTYEIREGRKSILGPLMNSMLANMMGSPKAKWAEFFNVFSESVREKHLLMYFFDEDKQAAVEALGAAGRITDYPHDYLHINDTNFAGAKSNLFVEQEVETEVRIEPDGSLTKKLVLTYRNPVAGDNCNLEAGQLCLNGLLRDWIRVYVPEGSVLKASRGFEVDMITTADLGKTVFEGFFTLAPESVKKLELEYTVPAGHAEEVNGKYQYQVLVQKQPGTKEIKHTYTLNKGKAQVFPVISDQEIVIVK